MFLVGYKGLSNVIFKMLNSQSSAGGNQSERMLAISNMLTLVPAGKHTSQRRWKGTYFQVQILMCGGPR